MPELRWTLLILGALFIGGLALWEWRRQRHARGPDNASGSFTGVGAGSGARDGERIAPTFDGMGGHEGERSHAFEGGLGRREGERISPTFEGVGEGSFAERSSSLTPTRGAFREPTLTFPEVSVEIPADARDRFADPPVVELDDESLDRLKVEAGEAVDEFSEPREPGEAVDDFSENLDEPSPATPMVPRLAAAAVAPTLAPLGELRVEREPAAALDPHDEPTTRFEVEPESGSEPVSQSRPAAGAPLGTQSFDPVEPIVDWPEEDTRKIVALRLVSGTGERFAGRAVRLALAAEGFVLGKFDIFHKPGPDARAVLSAASLTKPGTFSLATMDAQRFGGLSLFAVLPGPLSPLATFDELLTTARALNDRLRGALQDERGEPLTPMRSANIRDSLTASATAAAPVVGAAVAPPTVGSADGAGPP
jgi:FtsZ-interacting cell division protein ZipA